MNIENWSTIKKREVFSSKFLTIRNDIVKKPDNKTTEFIVVEQKNFVATLCLTDENKIVLIRQFRYPWSQVSFEVPAGLMENGEKIEDAAIREIKEETGYNVSNIQFLVKYHPVAYSNGFGHIFFAHVSNKGKQDLDPDEFIEVSEFSIDEVEEMIVKGEIVHGSTIMAWYLTKQKKLI